MQKFKLFFISISIAAIFPTSMKAQKLGLGGALGVRSDLNTKAKGFAQSIYVYNRFTDRLSLECGLGHDISESQSAIYHSESNLTFIRNKDQPVPIKEYAVFNWSEETFPKIDISDKGNRYDNLFVYLVSNYKLFQKQKHFGQIGMGAGLHRKDHSEQIGSIKASEAYFPIGGFAVSDLEIPIFSYNTFLDYSLIPRATYGYNLTKRLNILLESNLFVYPKSKTMSLNFGLGFNVNL